jgi:hypothetical protein
MPESTIVDLGQKVKAKYPGQYDDLSDAEVGQKVKIKFPGQYDDFKDVAPAPPPAGVPHFVPPGLQPERLARPSVINGPTTFTDQQTLADLTTGVPLNVLAERISPFINRMFPAGATPRPGANPPLTPEQEIGQKVATVGAIASLGGNLASAAKAKFLPSAERAGQKFQQVAAAANDVPLNTAGAQTAVEKAQQIAKFGGPELPKPLADFANLTRPGAVTIPGSKIPVAIEPPPLNYEGGRLLATNTGDLLGSGELNKPQMKRAVGEFYDAMKSANREAAAKVGLGDVYDSAMKEFRQAKTIQQGVDILKKWGIAAAITLGGGGIALKAGKELLGF